MSKFITVKSEGKKYTINTEYIIRVDHQTDDNSGILRMMSPADLNFSLKIDEDSFLKLSDYLGFANIEDHDPEGFNLNLDKL